MDSTLACLAAWMPRQRWYAAKGRPPSLRLIGWWEIDNPLPGDEARLRTLLVSDEGSLPPVLYQVPIAERATAHLDADAEHVIGSPEPGTTFVDGAHDPAYAQALLALVTGGGEARGPNVVTRGIPNSAEIATGPRHASVLRGEQSNTSIIYAGETGEPIICKVFRQLHPGLNPDIELATALADAGSAHVPRAVGSLEARWPDSTTAAGSVYGSLAFAQEFLPGVEDAWRVALRAGARGDDFTERAGDLGAATADVHLSLAALFPTPQTDDASRAATSATWRRRLSIAIAEVPAIAERQAAIERVYERAEATWWPHRQRIHGDYHLGQVLLVPDRGWVLLDFEGEPLRPMAERREPDLALRDVAGMLRSFDYVAGSIRQGDPARAPGAAQEWARSARTAFLDGYCAASGTDLDDQRELLAALELDKAVYEAIYEARNRPTWVSIPLRAIARLADRSETVV
ncbi:maltokinase N-terminal cap-like domain-containing protein [Microbacterium sp.]|uniref:maltokinase N-terminal cap-like domain-containing protein n=1 Tax=Microbacterium sp. TaxID=51671 RepID=UPI003F6E9D85